MRPDDDTGLHVPQRGMVHTPPRHYDAAHSAVANLARQQISSIYDQQSTPQPSTQPDQTPPETVAAEPQAATSTPSAYQRTHQVSHTADAAEWQRYHSAWQDYYQKYYERYYTGAVAQLHKTYSTASEAAPTAEHPTAQPEPPAQETMDTDEAMYDLRSQIVQKVQSSGKKVRKSRHFMPIVAALSVLVLFTGLQFNRVIIANVKAYVTPGEIDPQNIVVDPSLSTKVGPEPLLIIPKISVSVPIVFNTSPDYDSQMAAMEKGVAYFGIPGANSKPGQVGNTVISGHSSNDFIDAGNYKFVFALLERMKKGDIFYIHYKGTRYTYTVSNTKVVSPTNVQSLIYPTSKPEVTLITCTPLGTALNRLLVTGVQVSPDPTKATEAPQTSSSDQSAAQIPGNSPTILQRLFGN